MQDFVGSLSLKVVGNPIVGWVVPTYSETLLLLKTLPALTTLNVILKQSRVSSNHYGSAYHALQVLRYFCGLQATHTRGLHADCTTFNLKFEPIIYDRCRCQ